MQGHEILERFYKASKLVSQRAERHGEIGDFLRHHGYLVDWDGFSVCNFGEQDVHLGYTSGCCGCPWHLVPCIYCGDGYRCDKVPISTINPKFDYDVPLFLSECEKLEKGIIAPKVFGVFKTTNRTRNLAEQATTLEKADDIAKRLCQNEIQSLRKDPELRRYTASSAQNNAFLAKERRRFRHYEAYNYDGHPIVFAVEDITRMEEG